MTGTYILQSNRAAFNQNAIDPTCLLCKNGEETIKHFLLSCTALSSAREPIIEIITDTGRHASLLSNPTNDPDRLLQLPLLKENLAASLLKGCRKVTAKKSFAAELRKSSQDFAASGNVPATFTQALQKLYDFLQPAGNFATGSPEKHPNAIKHHRFAKRIYILSFHSYNMVLINLEDKILSKFLKYWSLIETE